jgi:tetratricopeptide (TPR) repeat protein
MVRTITELQKVLIQKTKPPDEADHFFNKAVKLGEEKKYAEAIACYEEPIRLDPTNKIAQKYRALLEKRQKENKFV